MTDTCTDGTERSWDGSGETTIHEENMKRRRTEQLIECGRCRSGVLQADMRQDPRWEEVCDECHKELLKENGPYVHTDTDQ